MKTHRGWAVGLYQEIYFEDNYPELQIGSQIYDIILYFSEIGCVRFV